MSKSKTLKELLECEFTVNENGKMVGEIPLERINEIAYILTNQKEKIDKVNKILYDDNLCHIKKLQEIHKILGDKEK